MNATHPPSHPSPRRAGPGRARVAACVLAAAAAAACAAGAGPAEDPVLARVDLSVGQAAPALPTHAMLQAPSGTPYALVIASPAALDRAGHGYQVLDTDARTTAYLLAARWPTNVVVPEAARRAILHDDGITIVARASAANRACLLGLGLFLKRLPAAPLPSPAEEGAAGVPLAPGPVVRPFAHNPLVERIVKTVQSPELLSCVRLLSGEDPVIDEGAPYTVLTRRTQSGTPVNAATQFAYERFAALGLSVEYHAWTLSGYTDRNVVATQPGGTRSNELVLVTAHVDSVPGSGRAPGADDNASGSAAVLSTAGVFSRYCFERTIRYVLFTGEEQMLLGSDRYAAAADAAGDNIVAVLNMDMIAWDAKDGPTLRLHTRTTGNAGYAGDRAIAATFTNVVATYGLADLITPIIAADGLWYSDHSSFWDVGYPAILAIEDDRSDGEGDFNAYYHSTGDTIDKFNVPYFTHYAKALIGTVAHLALPTAPVPRDVIEVVNSDWTPGSGLGAGVFYAKRSTNALETGSDPNDTPWTNVPANPNAAWLKLHTAPDGDPLHADERPTGGATLFEGTLSVAAASSTNVTATNRLRFAFVAPPDPDHVYSARVRVGTEHAADAGAFLCVGDLRDIVADGGYIDLPGTTGVSNGAAYGTCEIRVRPLDTATTNCVLRGLALAGHTVTLTPRIQCGARVADTVQVSTNLIATDAWTAATVATNRPGFEPASFDGGWTNAACPVDVSSLSNAPALHFRFERRWLDL